MPRHNSRNMTILFITLVVVMMGFGMVIPLLGFYVDSFGASGVELGLLMTSYALMQFLFAPVWGGLSDRFGRKPLLVLGVLGNALTQLFFGLATHLWMLFAARILAGILSSATLPTAMAYVGDSTSEDQRSSGMGLMGAAMGVGMVIGPGAGGLLARDSLALPFLVASGLSMIALALLVIILPESLPPDRRARRGDAQTGRGPQLRQMARALSGPIGILLVMAFLVSFGITNFETVFSLYTLERYGYGPQRVSFILMLSGLLSAVVQGVLTGWFTRRWGEVRVIRGALFIGAVGFVLMTTAERPGWVIATTLFFMIGNSLLRPTVSALTSRRAVVGQGTAMGLNNAFMSLGRVVGPTWAGFLFDVNLNLPYFSGAAILFAGFVVSLLWLVGREKETASAASATHTSIT
jgi:DHA1 family multidrug resistance protein-like MFS transporter